MDILVPLILPSAAAAFIECVPVKDPTGAGAQAIARLASNVIAAVGGRVDG
jgi:hypothetical protein